MKNIVFCLALGALFFDHAYSTLPVPQQEPTAGASLAIATEALEYKVSHNPVYVKTRLTQEDVTKKGAVILTPQNTLYVMQAFIDSLSETLEETGEAVGTELDSAVDAFKATLSDQKEIIGSTAKDLFKTLEEKAKAIFPSKKFAMSLDEKLHTVKFTKRLGGDYQVVRREPKDICCGILACILSTSYDYLQKQQDMRESVQGISSDRI